MSGRDAGANRSARMSQAAAAAGTPRMDTGYGRPGPLGVRAARTGRTAARTGCPAGGAR